MNARDQLISRGLTEQEAGLALGAHAKELADRVREYAARPGIDNEQRRILTGAVRIILGEKL